MMIHETLSKPDPLPLEQRIVTIDFTRPVRAYEFDEYDQILLDWRNKGFDTVDAAWSWLFFEALSRFAHDERRAWRDIERHCMWLPEWKAWVKKQEEALGTANVTLEPADAPFRIIVKPDFSANTQWRIYSAAELIETASERPLWAIEGILERRSGLLVSGLPHAMKSLALLAALLESVTTRKVWGKFPVPSAIKNVLFVETEDSRRLVGRRLKGLYKGLNLKGRPVGFHAVCSGPFDLLNDGEQTLRQLIAETKADIVVLSTLQGLLNGLDWKEQKDMSAINAIFVRLQQLCSLIVITHSPWSEKRAAGSVTQAANFASLMHLDKKVRDDGTTVAIATLDGKEIDAEQKFSLALETEQVEYADGKITTQVRRIRYVERDMGGRPETADAQKPLALALWRDGNSVREIEKQLRVSKSTVHRWLREEK